MITAMDEGYIKQEIQKEVKEQIDQCLRLLNGYIRFLQKMKNQ